MLPLTCPSLPSQASTVWILGMEPPPNVAVEPRPTESSLKRRWTMWAPSLNLHPSVLSPPFLSHPLTWGTHECQSRWRSPWAGQISSCVSWWRPWRGSQIHRYPERPPAPSELQPQPTASWRRKKALLVTVVMSHSNNNICDCSRILTPTSSSCTSQTSLTSHPGSRFYLLHLLRHKDSGWWVIRELKIDLWFERCTYTTLVSNSVTAFD